MVVQNLKLCLKLHMFPSYEKSFHKLMSNYWGLKEEGGTESKKGTRVVKRPGLNKARKVDSF